MDEKIDDESLKIVESIINKFHTALINPITSSFDDIDNLIQSFPLSNTQENDNAITELIEEIIHSSELPNDLRFEEAISVASSNTSETWQKPGFLNYWWSKFTRQSSHEELETSSTRLPISSIPSIDSNQSESADESAVENAKREVMGLEAQGPAGLLHISALSNVLNRRILVWKSSTTLCHDIGKRHPGPVLNVQYRTNPGEILGHWTLLGGEEPENIEADLNDCLFAAIAAQTGQKPSELRSATVQLMKKRIKSLSVRIEELAQREECGEIMLMIGGAKYDGKSANCAKTVLENSQYGRSHPGNQRGHPRGHASEPGTSGTTESAENYSRGSWKTAFLSRADQDRVGHIALSTPDAQGAMDKLNDGATRVVVEIPAREINEQLPQVAHFYDGRKDKVEDIKKLLLVLQHHAGHQRDPDYDVFVHTFYPKQI